jgi:peptidyl-prolyl cis-trans isomerase B (cyclophilin B)
MTPSALTLLSVLFSILVPQKMWYAPTQPLTISNKSDKPIALELTDFTGKVVSPKSAAEVAAGASVDLKSLYPDTANPGTWILYALPTGGNTTQAPAPKDVVGTPLVIETRPQQQNPTSTVVTRILPLQYAVMTTDSGPLTEVFYYDVAPNTVENFLTLAGGGYYDGLVFHRVVPGFVIQGGDPLGADPDPQKRGTGGPGYMIGAEFNDHPHLEGVLSMARAQDPNSAGSQFFVCLNYAQTQQLDHQYTAFGKVVEGMDAVKSIAAAKIDGETPEHPVSITKVEIFPVTAAKDPYTAIMSQ